ncbi:hypothetical protein L541_0637 [Bordetella hinzii CA90 BAL1384]|nr:hypothetical protein L541_0637 [Bordetella hinzii CA90 BAL1384]KCB41909.1 hypothetical protein L539_0577 [Bordetella hinzii 5132]
MTHREDFTQKQNLCVRRQPQSSHDSQPTHQYPTYSVHSDHP